MAWMPIIQQHEAEWHWRGYWHSDASPVDKYRLIAIHISAEQALRRHLSDDILLDAYITMSKASVDVVPNAEQGGINILFSAPIPLDETTVRGMVDDFNRG